MAEVKYYPSKDLCERFDISSSTLRKRAIALEDNGYEFSRTEQNRRLFTERDLNTLQYLQELIQDKNMNLENASIIVASRFKEDRSYTGTSPVREDDSIHSSDTVKILQDHIEKQEQFNQELLRRLDEQNKYINERLDNRDKTLMNTMNEMLEERKSNQKLLEEVKEEQKKGLLAKLFKKK